MIAGVLIALIVGVIGHLMPARTVPGTRTLEQVLGFEEFLSRVEKENYARVVKTPEMFERFLPFAMAFGVERTWAKAFKDIVHEPPRWYSGGNMSGFDAGQFSGRMSALSSSAGSAMTSSPRSSGGSGFSGGGSSGGHRVVDQGAAGGGGVERRLPCRPTNGTHVQCRWCRSRLPCGYRPGTAEDRSALWRFTGKTSVAPRRQFCWNSWSFTPSVGNPPPAIQCTAHRAPDAGAEGVDDVQLPGVERRLWRTWPLKKSPFVV